MDKFSYAIGLGIGQNLLSMGAKGIAVDDFAQAIKDVLEGNQTAISHQEAREIVNKYFEELEAKMGAAAIEQGNTQSISKFLSMAPHDNLAYKNCRGVYELMTGNTYEGIRMLKAAKTEGSEEASYNLNVFFENNKRP